MKVVDELAWEEIAGYLKEIPGYAPSKSGNAEAFATGDVSNRMFFKIEYEPGEIIMPQGVCTDFAGLLLDGCVKVVDAPDVNKLLARERQAVECWRPRSRWLVWIERMFGKQPTVSEANLADPIDREILDDTNSEYIGRRKARDYPGDDHYDKALDDGRGAGQLRPALRRFIGLTGAMWNTPRTYTLVAEDDKNGRPCTLLLIKRKVLLTIDGKSAEFRAERKQFFVEKELPGQLLPNRLFANTLYADDIVDWRSLVQTLQMRIGRERDKSTRAVQRIRSHWDADFRRWFDALKEEVLGDFEQYEVLRGLNTSLRNDGLFDEAAWKRDTLPKHALAVLEIDPKKRTRNEIIQLNRCLYETALPGAIHSQDHGPLSKDEYVEYVTAICSIAKELEQSKIVEEGRAIQLVHGDFDPKGESKAEEKRTDRIYRQGAASEGLYLLLSGRVKVTKSLADSGGEVLVNHLSQHGYFGLSCIRNGQGSRHSVTVTAMSQVDMVVLHREVVLRLAERFPFLDRKLKHELNRLDRRIALGRLPPSEPPERFASKLMAATNLLLIDMDLCTRCDQCVQACHDAHDGVARFHRSNPDLRFNQWEVAGACVHCEDPPCQKACPVGAITVEFDGTVQVHRNRCIGCTLCAGACPFDVIDMLPPMQHDRPLSVPKVEKNGVATKCDLCLTKEKDPPCVMGCPYGAAQRGAPRDLFPGIKSWAQVTPT